MRGRVNRWLGAAAALALLLCGGIFDGFGQEFFREFPRDERDELFYAPMLQSDTTLFYRAAASAADLYERCSDYALPQVATARRGTRRSDEQLLLDGLPVENYRTLALLRLLGASERYRPEGDLRATQGGALPAREYAFDDALPLQPARLGLALTDRNYRVGVRGSWQGRLGRGWSTAAAVDLRTGRDLHIAGVFTDAVTAGARFVREAAAGDRWEITFAVPLSLYGGRGAAPEEAFALTGDRCYNPSWGYQNGKVRNARVRREVLPLLRIGWERPVSAATTLAVTAGAEAGVQSVSGLNWYDARTPQPDYYRYLPGFTGDRATDEAWRSGDPHYTQIDWDRLIAANRLAAGKAVYTLEEEVGQLGRFEGVIRCTIRPEARLQLHCGLTGSWRQSRRFKRMSDLLGAAFVTDIDQYLVDDATYGNLLQNNLRDPDRRIVEGDRFGYDYTLFAHELRLWGEALWQSDRLLAGASASFGGAVRYRRGHYEKELFPGSGSYGDSRRMHFAPWAVQAFAGWAFSPRHRIDLRLQAAAVTPETEELFCQPLYNNRTVDRPQNLRRLAAEALWRWNGRNLEWQSTLFVSVVQHIGMTSRYYDDWAGLYADRIVAGMGICTFGLETALCGYLGERWRLSAAGALLRSRYIRNPTVTLLADTDNRLIDDRAVSYLGNCRPGGVPQATAAAEVRYFGPKGWGFRCSAGYAGGRYAEPDPVRRTQRIARQAGTTPEAFAAFVGQERLADAFTLDAALFKQLRIGRRGSLMLTLSARNLTGGQAQYNGYESPRIRRRYAGDTAGWEPQATRYTYVYPRSFYLSAVCRF